MIVSCYDMHLYCDNGNDIPGMTDEGKTYAERSHGYEEGFGQFLGQTEAQCKAQAKAAGWRFARDGRCYCPKHA